MPDAMADKSGAYRRLLQSNIKPAVSDTNIQSAADLRKRACRERCQGKKRAFRRLIDPVSASKEKKGVGR